jgi:chemotaxis protein MotB
MQANGIRADQVTQVRGFADQSLRKPDKPLDPSNRRVSLIVQYLPKAEPEDDAKPSVGGEEKKPEAGKPEEKPAKKE